MPGTALRALAVLGVVLGGGLGAAQADAPPGLIEQSVEVDVGGGELRGTLWRPADGDKPRAGVPGVVIIAGSGATDRNGNQPSLRNDSLKLLAAALGTRGIATLRFDKRVLPASRLPGVTEETIRLDHFVDDAVRWADLLRAEKGIARLFLAGHSQGALIATLAAQRLAEAGKPVAGVILLAGPGEPIGAVLRRQLGAANLPKSLRDEAFAIIASLEQGRVVPKINRLLVTLFRPSVQPFLISWMRHDPAKALAAVKAPALIVQGTRDLQVGPDQAKRLKAARPDASLVTIQGMNHVFKVPKGDGRAANVAAYSDPSLPLAPGLAAAVADFILKTK